MLELYQRVALCRNLPDPNLREGNVVIELPIYPG